MLRLIDISLDKVDLRCYAGGSNFQTRGGDCIPVPFALSEQRMEERKGE